MKKININNFLQQRKKAITMPELLQEVNKSGCKCSIEDISQNIWDIYK